jgi:hypothetical protein
MTCFECGNEENFVVEDTLISQYYHGKKVEVFTPLTFCISCGWSFCDKGQADELIKRIQNQMNIDYPEAEQSYQEKLSIEFKKRLKEKYEK